MYRCTWLSDPDRSHNLRYSCTEDSFIAHLSGWTAKDKENLLNLYFKKYL